MLVDERRMRAFAEAVKRSVRPGDVVLDIGAGTGVLSFLACTAGASRVYAVEQGPVIELARELSERNGFDDRVVFINDWSTAVNLSEPADVVVTETIGNAALDEGIIAWTIDARHRLLRHGGLVVPQRIRLCTAAVESWDDHAQVSDWSAPSLPVDFSMIRELATRTVWPVELRADQLLTAPAVAADVDLRVATDSSVTASGASVFRRAGTFHGLACWFEAELVDGVDLDNAPPTAAPSWAQGYLPVAQPLAVTVDDTLEWEIAVSPGGDDWTWSVELT
jgi:protein arginine N-methyltransferase 1